MPKMRVSWEWSEYKGTYDGKYGNLVQYDMATRVGNTGIDSVVDTSLLLSPTQTGAYTLYSAEKVFKPFADNFAALQQPITFYYGNPNYPNAGGTNTAVNATLDGEKGTTILANGVSVKSDVSIYPLYNGMLYARYDVLFFQGSEAYVQGFSGGFYVYVVDNKNPLPRWNAKQVIDRLLLKAETLRRGQDPRFHLNAAQAEEFAKIEVPEMHFTNCTLREALQTVGSYIHGEPRLHGNEISFDMYGGNEKTDVPFSEYIAKSFQQSIDSAITSVDSTVDNLVSTIGYAKGVTVEPYAGGYKTVRTETLYARIQDDNMLIAVSHGINRIIKVECGFVGNVTDVPIDITPYIFEESEYARMSAYTEIYPTSRVYALYYTQGGSTIEGLHYKIPKAVGQVFGDYAIVRILKAATGNNNLSITDYPALAFRVTYESITSARVKQNKQYIIGSPLPTEIAYNQGQNLIESGYYGENLKGVVARLGNVDKVITLYQRGTPKIPKVGTLYDDDYYISAVAVEIMPFYTKISCALSKDFNRYSDYVSVNSTRRFYEVSERQAYESFIHYRDYVVIGDDFTSPAATPQTPLCIMDDIVKAFDPNIEYTEVVAYEVPQSDITINVISEGVEYPFGTHTGRQLVVRANGISSGETVYLELNYTYEDIISGRNFSGSFTGETTLPYYTEAFGGNLGFTTSSTASAKVTKYVTQSVPSSSVTLAVAQGYNADFSKTCDNTVMLPVKALPLGNAAVFTFRYKDNYSAGDQAVYAKAGEVEGYYQNGVQYKNYYGNMEYLAFGLLTRGRTPKEADEQKTIGMNLPLITNPQPTDYKIECPRETALHVSVGSTEIPIITYQIDFVTNRKDIVVGSGIAQNLPLVSGAQSDKAAKLYVLPNRVNKFAKTVDLTGATKIVDNVSGVITVGSVASATFASQTSTVAGEAWAIVDPDGLLLIAENKHIAGDGTTDILGGLKLTLTHEVYR